MEPGPYMPAFDPLKSTSQALPSAKQLKAQLDTAKERSTKQQSWLKEKDQQLQSLRSHAGSLQASMDTDSIQYHTLLKKTTDKEEDLNAQLASADERVDELCEVIKQHEAKLKSKRKQYKKLQAELKAAIGSLTADQAQSIVVQQCQQHIREVKASNKSLVKKLATSTTQAVEAGANIKRQSAARRAVQVQMDQEVKRNASIKRESEAAQRTWAQEKSRFVHRVSQLEASQQVQRDAHALQQQELAKANQQLRAARAANTQVTTELESAQKLAVDLLRATQLADEEAASTAAVLREKEQRIERLKIAQACGMTQLAAQEQQQAAVQTLLQQRLSQTQASLQDLQVQHAQQAAEIGHTQQLLQQRLSQTQASLQDLQAQQGTELGHAQQSLAEARQQLQSSQELQLTQSTEHDAMRQELAHATQQLHASQTAHQAKSCECEALQHELVNIKAALETAQHAAQAKSSASAAAHAVWNDQAAEYKAQLAELQQSVAYKALHLAAGQAHALPSTNHISQLQTRLGDHISKLQLALNAQDAADHTTMPPQLSRAMLADLKSCTTALVELKAAEARRTTDSDKAIARVADKNAELQETVSAHADHTVTPQAQLDTLHGELDQTKLHLTAATGQLEDKAAAAPSMTGPAEGEEATGSQPAPPAPTYRTRASRRHDKGQLYSIAFQMRCLMCLCSMLKSAQCYLIAA